MKCSLLTLSTFIDDELPAPRRAEVDAHLVGCPRCTAGVATLREEKARVGQLARVHVDSGSAQSMLEQVGITVDSVTRAPAPATPSPPEGQLPWQSGRSSPSLPWTPRRPKPAPATPEMGAPDAQPELPLEGVRSSPAFWDRGASSEVDDPVALPMVEALHPAADLTESSATPAYGDDADQEWVGTAAPPESWETDLPPPLDAPAADDASWGLDHALIEPSQPPPAPPLPPAVPVPISVPTRLAAAAGPAAVWSRIRDAVSVRLALSRGAEAAESSMQIVSGAPLQRGAQLAEAAAAAPPEVVAQAPSDPPAAAAATAAAPDAEVELQGLARPSEVPVTAYMPASRERTADADRTPPGRSGRRVDAGDREPPPDPEVWNAFAASSYPIEADPTDEPTVTPPRPLGRHSRAVARERVALSTRVGRAMVAMAAAMRLQSKSAAAVVRQRMSGISRAGPDSRILAGVAAIGLIFVIALLIGHNSKPTAPAAARSAPAAVVTHPTTSAPAHSSAPAQTVAPSTIPAQTFGSGASGFQLIRLRYGVQPSSAVRVVFDLGAAGATVSGSPKVVVSFTDPTTMLVTLYGTLPAGSTGVPPPGKAIASVTLVSSAGGTTVYRFGLTHAVTPTAFYLQSPTRFVLDLH